jgi:hypothetical protein
MLYGTSMLKHAIAISCIALFAGCASNPRSDDKLSVRPDDDIFIGQTPYGMDESVIVLARIPEAEVRGGAVTLTGGRTMVVAPPGVWRSYTGVAKSAEDARLDVQRSERLRKALALTEASLRDTEHRLNEMEENLSKSYRARYSHPPVGKDGGLQPMPPERDLTDAPVNAPSGSTKSSLESMPSVTSTNDVAVDVLEAGSSATSPVVAP